MEFTCLCNYSTKNITPMKYHLDNNVCGMIKKEEDKNNILCICNICSKRYKNLNNHMNRNHNKKSKMKKIENKINELENKIQQLNKTSATSNNIINNSNVNSNNNNNNNNNININNYFIDYRLANISHVKEEELFEKTVEAIQSRDEGINYFRDFLITFLYFHDDAIKQRSVMYDDESSTWVFKDNNMQKIQIEQFTKIITQNKYKLFLDYFRNLCDENSTEEIIKKAKDICITIDESDFKKYCMNMNKIENNPNVLFDENAFDSFIKFMSDCSEENKDLLLDLVTNKKVKLSNNLNKKLMELK